MQLNHPPRKSVFLWRRRYYNQLKGTFLPQNDKLYLSAALCACFLMVWCCQTDWSAAVCAVCAQLYSPAAAVLFAWCCNLMHNVPILQSLLAWHLPAGTVYAWLYIQPVCSARNIYICCILFSMHLSYTFCAQRTHTKQSVRNILIWCSLCAIYLFGALHAQYIHLLLPVCNVSNCSSLWAAYFPCVQHMSICCCLCGIMSWCTFVQHLCIVRSVQAKCICCLLRTSHSLAAVWPHYLELLRCLYSIFTFCRVCTVCPTATV
jgi:hypothetical protein